MDTPDTLAADMLKAAASAVVATQAVVAKGALNVKTEARANVLKSAPTRNAHAHLAITYDDPSVDVRFGSPTIGTEIGYDKDKRGGDLGNILEYGTRTSPPHRDLGRALDSEEPRFEGALAAVIGKLL